MAKIDINEQTIYLNQMMEVQNRLCATDKFISTYLSTECPIEFDCAVLQFRKALEATAYAAIAPNKEQYCNFRKQSETEADFSKDFNSSKIFQSLENINKNFYPLALISPIIESNSEIYNFGRKKSGFLSKKAFKKIYDRLGKFLHADNPWGTDKNHQNLAKDIQKSILELRELLELHATFIQTETFSGVWVVRVPKDNSAPSITEAQAMGDFIVA